MKSLIPLILLAVIFVIGLPFVAMIMGSVDAGVDMTDNEYEDEYDSITDTSTGTLGIMKIIPILIAVVILIGAVGLLRAYVT